LKAIKAATGVHLVLVNEPKELTPERLTELNPRYIFFPHWSHIIPASIYNRFECVIFHMTDVPYGRGGSPLQNLIVRGHKQTKISAIRCVRELDAGPVYLKYDLSLAGTAGEILDRAYDTIEQMIVEILKSQPEPQPQIGEAVVFKRRRPEDGDIANFESLETIFDYIRMLDGEGYPPAFVDVGKLHIEFSHAKNNDDVIVATAVIRIKRSE
jgi:methionyl-tRNA formyltransferase